MTKDISRPLKVKKLKHVYQMDPGGCFVAALAMAIGKSYSDTFKITHPNQNLRSWVEHWIRQDIAEELILNNCRDAKASKVRKFDSLKKNAIIFIKWRNENHSHCLVWDNKRKILLDPLKPFSHRVPGYLMSEYESQISTVYYFKRPIVQAK